MVVDLCRRQAYSDTIDKYRNWYRSLREKVGYTISQYFTVLYALIMLSVTITCSVKLLVSHRLLGTVT